MVGSGHGALDELLALCAPAEGALANPLLPGNAGRVVSRLALPEPLAREQAAAWPPIAMVEIAFSPPERACGAFCRDFWGGIDEAGRRESGCRGLLRRRKRRCARKIRYTPKGEGPPTRYMIHEEERGVRWPSASHWR